MSKAEPISEPITLLGHRGVREGAAFLLGAVGIYFALALLSYSPLDPGWSVDGNTVTLSNSFGRFGALSADLLLSGFGLIAYLMPLLLGWSAWRLLRRDQKQRAHLPSLNGVAIGLNPRTLVALRISGVLLLCLALAILASLHIARGQHMPVGGGGIVGRALAEALLPLLGLAGTTLLGLVGVLAGSAVGLALSWLSVLEVTGRLVRVTCQSGLAQALQLSQLIANYRARREQRSRRQHAIAERQTEIRERPAPKVLPRAPKAAQSPRVAAERQRELFARAPTEGLPPISLLDAAESRARRGYSPESLEAMSRLLELKLRDFGVDAQVVSVQPGPVITRFELQPAAGVKVSRITALVKDLARSLAVVSVRVVEVIPGRSVVGIEIPNEDREIVRLSEILSTNAYEQAESPMSLAFGKDISGEPVIFDLGRMPHLLVAGTTGSGKSVGVNAMILSMLFKATPEQLRLILIDPKMLELSVYEGIPHLLTPVVTDMRDAAAALRWCVAEMDRRYRLLAALGVRQLASYNKKVQQANERGTPLADPLYKGDEERTLQTLPYVVVVIDEFADMMMVVGKKVEELINRIAQKARAAGIHLLLATQRPSVDVITGLIKSNIPGRLSFQVSSKIDSRTILDQGGAEQLLGHGDMLFLPGGTSLPMRIHGAFVSDEEVHRVAADWRSRGTPDYLSSITSDGDEGAGSGEGREGNAEQDDPLYDQAVALVLESRRASISAVQRRLRIGYNRAARLIESMEAAGVVSAMNSAGGRDVLVPERVE